jgi:hypothetical protein
MAHSSCITYPKHQFTVLRSINIDLCDGNRCAAMLISYFEYKRNLAIDRVMDRIKYAEENDLDFELTDNMLAHKVSVKMLIDGLLGEYGKDKISDSVDLLVRKEYLEEFVAPIIQRRNGLPDTTKSYLLNINKIQHDLDVLEATKTKNPMKSPVSDFQQSAVSGFQSTKDYKERQEQNIKADTPYRTAPEGAGESRPLLRRRKPPEAPVVTPTFIRRKASIYGNELVEGVFKHWNSLGYPLTVHKTNNGVFSDSILAIKAVLVKYSPDNIKQAMDNYHRLLLDENTSMCKQYNPMCGLVVSLPEFFRFGNFTKDKIKIWRGKNPNEPFPDCWFKECLGDYDFLAKTYKKAERFQSKKVVPLADNNPLITREVERFFNTNYPDLVSETNKRNFIKSAERILEYHTKHKSHIVTPGFTEPHMLVKKMFEMLRHNGRKDGFGSHWLCTDIMINQLNHYLCKVIGFFDEWYNHRDEAGPAPEPRKKTLREIMAERTPEQIERERVAFEKQRQAEKDDIKRRKEAIAARAALRAPLPDDYDNG